MASIVLILSTYILTHTPTACTIINQIPAPGPAPKDQLIRNSYQISIIHLHLESSGVIWRRLESTYWSRYPQPAKTQLRNTHFYHPHTHTHPRELPNSSILSGPGLCHSLTCFLVGRKVALAHAHSPSHYLIHLITYIQYSTYINSLHAEPAGPLLSCSTSTLTTYCLPVCFSHVSRHIHI